MSAVVIYLANTLTPATGIAITPVPVQAGSFSDPVELDVWCAPGSPGSPASGPITLKPVIVDGATLVTSGVPFLDQAYVYVQLTGVVINTSDPLMTGIPTGESRVGSQIGFEVPSISADCARRISVRIRAPQQDGALSETDSWQLRQVHDELSAPVTDTVGRDGDGIITGTGDLNKFGWITPPAVTPTGTPDAVVHVGWRWIVTRGIPFWIVNNDITLNQNDGAVAALTAGQEYLAILSQPWIGGAAVATKGLRATAGSAVFPATPASSYVIGWVRVLYHAAASVITSGNIFVTAVADRFQATTSGLDVTVSAGRAKTRGLELVAESAATVTMTDGMFNWIWLNGGGLVVTTTATPQSVGDLPLYKADADGTVTLSDLRVMYEPNRVDLVLKDMNPEAVGTNLDFAAAEGYLVIDRIRASLGFLANGASGDTIYDIQKGLGGTYATIFTDSGGSPESRPDISSAGYTTANAMPQVTRLSPGECLVLNIDQTTSGGTPASNSIITVTCIPMVTPS